MTDREIKQLKREYPETPHWVIERNYTLAEAREVMRLRRLGFPAQPCPKCQKEE